MDIMIQQTRWPLGRSRSTGRALLPWAILIVLMAGAAAALGPSRAWSAEPEVVARVNGEPVTRRELQRMLGDPLTRRQLQQELGGQEPGSNELKRSALRKLINRRLVLQEARRREFTVTQQDLSRATTALRSRFKDLKEFGAWMKARGLDDISLQESLREQTLTTRVMAALVEGVRLTDEQVQEYYAAHMEDLKTPEEVRLRIIAVTDKEAAEAIWAALQKGGNFERLAQERSTGFGATEGGDMGWVSAKTLAQPLREAIGTLKAGETGGPVQIGAEFLLVRVEERRPARTRSLAEVRPEIEGHLLAAKRQEVFQAWLAEQEKQAKIEVFL
jgi:parvulin-like peptidyl-prolyl isomerase